MVGEIICRMSIALITMSSLSQHIKSLTFYPRTTPGVTTQKQERTYIPFRKGWERPPLTHISERKPSRLTSADVIYDDRKHQENLDFQQDVDFAVSFLRRDCDEAQDRAEHIKNAGKST